MLLIINQLFNAIFLDGTLHCVSLIGFITSQHKRRVIFHIIILYFSSEISYHESFIIF